MNKTFATLGVLAVMGGGGVVVTDASVNPYTDKVDRLEVEGASVLQDGGRISAQLMKDRPEVILSKWDDAAGLSIKYDKIQAKGSRALLTDRMEWKGAKEELHAYPLGATEQMEDGGFEVEVYLKQKPDTNTFDFTLAGTEELDFFYQAPLTQTEIDLGASQPANVVGSYAVYHKSLKNHQVGDTNYSTGKLFHIFRPKAVDADGNEVWAQLSYDDAGTLTVTVPQDFLDNANYPVRVDPTFGVTSVGASTGTWGSGGTGCSEAASKITTSGAITNGFEISAYMSSLGIAGSGFRTAIWNDSAGSPGTLVASSSYLIYQIQATSTAQWMETSVPTISLNASTDYWIGGGNNSCDSGFGTQPAADTTGGTHAYREGLGITDPFGTPSSTGTFLYSVYLTYGAIGDRVEMRIIGDHTWYAPTYLTSADVGCVGGGGGGGDGNATGGTGGGGGAFASSTVSVNSGAGYLVDIGLGGGAAGSGSSAAGSNAGDSTFNSTTVVADGGLGGAASGGAGGAGGTTANSTGSVEFAGGNGAAGETTGDTSGGGGGAAFFQGAGAVGTAGNGTVGGAGGTGANGAGSTGGISGNGANGGAALASLFGGGGGGGGDDGFAGGAAGLYGGGGGGGENGGGAGKAGVCLIAFTIPSVPVPSSDPGTIWFLND